MQRFVFVGSLHHDIELDLCFTCQGIWFDRYESAQIAPGGIIELFRLIHDRREQLRQPLARADPRRRQGNVHIAVTGVMEQRTHWSTPHRPQ